MLSIHRIFITSLLGVSIATTAFAEPEVTQRKENQQGRIANGIESGQLNAGEAARLERGEVRINQKERADRAADGGKLTNADKRQLNRMQNRESARIYSAKHNGVVGVRADQSGRPESKLDQRRENQQGRIASGLKSGQLTAGEAAHLERGEARINQQARTDRAANGGKLTNADRAQLNQMQNHQSERIYDRKHNGRTGARAR
jgi:hypothetical protein